MQYTSSKSLDVCHFSLFREQIYERLEQINDQHEPLLVFRPKGLSFVVMSVASLHELQDINTGLLAAQMRAGHLVKKADPDWWKERQAKKRAKLSRLSELTE